MSVRSRLYLLILPLFVVVPALISFLTYNTTSEALLQLQRTVMRKELNEQLELIRYQQQLLEKVEGQYSPFFVNNAKEDILEHLQRRSQINEFSYLITSTDGQIIYHSSADGDPTVVKNTFQQEDFNTLTTQFVRLDSTSLGLAKPEPLLFIYESVPNWDWIFAIHTPESITLQPARDAFRKNLVLILLAAFILIFSLSRIIKSITKPIGALYNQTRKISNGQIAEVETSTAGDEINQLSQAFNQMAKRLNQNHTELQQLNRSLEDKVSDRTKELEETNQKLHLEVLQKEHAQKAIADVLESKNRFIAHISHDLRTPLNAITGFAEILEQRIKEPQLHQYAATLFNSCSQLNALLTQLLDLSRLESGKLEIQKSSLNLHKLIQDTLNLFSCKANDKGLQLSFASEFDESPEIETDPLRVQQVLNNLLSNALKFTHQGRVEIILSHNESKTDELTITVKDTGPGVADGEQERIFQAYEQSDHPEKSQGLGLGLSICRHLAEALGGSLELTPESGYGAVFRFTLPYQKSKSQLLKSSHDIPRILIVDDQFQNRELLGAYLSDTHYDLKYAEDGLEAITTAKAWQPHLIFMDLKMPNMDGLTASSKLKDDPQTKEILIVMLTATVEQQQLKMASKLCDEVMTKPVSYSQLHDTIKQLLNH